MKYRHRVLGLLILLFAIVYLDRVCISVAGPRIQDDLHIDPVGWGWVTAMFTLSYCLFEIPTGALGDRIGPRRVLTRVVLWFHVADRHGVELQSSADNEILLRCRRSGGISERVGRCLALVPNDATRGHVRSPADGKSNWRGYRAPVGCADSDPLRMACILLYIRHAGTHLGCRLVHLVP